MISITFNTGDSAVVKPDIVRPYTLEVLLPLIKARSGVLPGSAKGYRFELYGNNNEGFVWTFYRGKEPLTTSGLALCEANSEVLWKTLENLYFETSELFAKQIGSSGFGSEIPEKPNEHPWVATVLLPPLAMTPQHDIGFIGHMSICFASIIVTI